jgi:hypothetical protein
MNRLSRSAVNRLPKFSTNLPDGFSLAFCLLILLSLRLSAQPTLDSVQLKPLRGALVSYASVTKNNPVVLICFWSSNIESSVNELNAINAQYEKWKQAASFKLMAICVDEGNILNRMRPTAIMNGWTFDVYGDINGDLQRIFPAPNLPESMILKNGQVVYQQAGFQAGSENYLFAKIKSLTPAGTRP